MVVRVLIVLLLLVSGSFRGAAQQCGYYGFGAILVSVIDAETKQKVPGLKMYLTYQNGDAIILVGGNIEKKQLTGACVDSMLFWDNNNVNPPKRNCDDTRIIRSHLPNAGDNYLCIASILNDKIDTRFFSCRQGNPFHENSESEQALTIKKNDFINLKIEGKKFGRKGDFYAPQLIRIPIASIIDICASNLDGLKSELNDEVRLRSIIVELKKNDSSFRATIQSDFFGKYIQPYYLNQIHRIGEEEVAIASRLSKAVLYEEQSGKILQTIYPPIGKEYGKEWADGLIEFGNFYGDITISTFRVPSKELSNEGREAREARNCYTYYTQNAQTKLYDLDTLLTNKSETKFNKDTRQMFAFDWVETREHKIENIYKLVNKNWVLVESNRYEIPKPATMVEQKRIAMFYIAEPYRYLPVQYFDRGETKVVSDTIWMTNYGSVSGDVELSNSNYFKAPRRVGPNDRFPIVYNRTFRRESSTSNNVGAVTGPFEQIADGLTIKCGGKEFSAGVQYSILNSSAQSFLQHDSSLHFRIPYKYDEVYFVSTFPNKTLKEMGRISLVDSCRIGVWTIIDSTEKYFTKRVQYTKALTIQLINDDITKCRLIIQYDTAATEVRNINGGKINVTRNMKYLYIKRDSSFAAVKIDFDKMQEYDGVMLYLLKPNQDFIYSGQIKCPVELNHHQYAIKWNPQFGMKQGSAPQQIQIAYKNYFSRLIDRFPNLQYRDIGSNNAGFLKGPHYEFYVADFTSCSPKEKSKIMELMQDDSNINAVCLLQNPDRPIFCDNSIYIIDKTNRQLDSAMITKAKQLGFNYQGLQVGTSYYQHNFKYKSKIVDREFFAAFNKLCEAGGLMQISLNTYARHLPEIPEKDLIRH